MPTCHARNRDGSPCRAEAVKGHTVCRMHGAGPPGARGGRPPIHGAYSKVVDPEEIATLGELRTLGLENEVALARLQLTRALAYATEKRKGRCDGRSCPLDVVDRQLELVSRMAERCRRVADGISVRLVDEDSLDRLVQVIQRHVTDPATLAAIAAELQAVGGGGA